MKKNFTTPSLKVDLFNKELILQASGVTPAQTNEAAAAAALQGAGVEASKIAKIEITL